MLAPRLLLITQSTLPLECVLSVGTLDIRRSGLIPRPRPTISSSTSYTAPVMRQRKAQLPALRSLFTTRGPKNPQTPVTYRLVSGNKSIEVLGGTHKNRWLRHLGLGFRRRLSSSGVSPSRRSVFLFPCSIWIVSVFRAARSAKVAAVQEAFASQPGGDRVEIIGIDDIIADDSTKALEGG